MADTAAQKRAKLDKLFMSEFHFHRYVDKDQNIATLVAANYLPQDAGLEVGDLILVTGKDATGLYSLDKYDKTGSTLTLVSLKSA